MILGPITCSIAPTPLPDYFHYTPLNLSVDLECVSNVGGGVQGKPERDSMFQRVHRARKLGHPAVGIRTIEEFLWNNQITYVSVD